VGPLRFERRTSRLSFTEHLVIEKSALIASHPLPYGDYTAAGSFPGGNGITMQGTGGPLCDTIIRDNVLYGCQYGIQPRVTWYSEIVGNWIDMSYQDPIQVSQHDGGNTPIFLCANLFTRNLGDVADNGGAGPHPDRIQFLATAGVPARNIVCEANIAWAGDSRGIGKSQGLNFAYANGSTGANGFEMLMRGNLHIDTNGYAFDILQTAGSRMEYNGFLPHPDQVLPTTGAVGEARFGNSLVSGTNELKNSHFEDGGGIAAGVARSGFVDESGWTAASYTAAMANWNQWPKTALPTMAQLMSSAAPVAAGAVDGHGPGSIITFAAGAERSAYQANVPAPVLSGIAVTPGATDFAATLRTTVDLNPIFWAVVPAGTTGITPAQIKRRMIPGALDYGFVDVPLGQTGVDLAITGSTGALAASTSHDLVLVQTNGYSVESAVATASFTTTAAAASPGITASVATNPVGTGNSIVANISANQPGDQLFLIVVGEEGWGPTTPAGWTFLGTVEAYGAAGNSEGYVYTRVAGASEPATVTVSYANSKERAAVCFTARGYTALGNHTLNVDNSVFSATARATPTIAGTSGNLLVSVWVATTATAIAPPPGLTVLQNISGNTTSMLVGYETLAATGPTVSRTATKTAATAWGSAVFEIS